MKTIDHKVAVCLVAEGDKVSPERRQELQNQRLHELVDYARANSPYFAKLYADLPENYTLRDLPPTQKSILNDHYEDWVTDRRITLEMVEEFVSRDSSDNRRLLDEYTGLKTSGSTGKSLPVLRDEHRNLIHGELMNQRLFGSVDPELLNPSKHRMAYIIHVSFGASSYNGFIRMRSVSPDRMNNMKAISVMESIDKIVEELNEFQPETIVGYPSSLMLLANEKERGTLNIPVKLIGSSSENLPESTHHRLEKVFGCKVINNYCMTEGGEIAMTRNCAHLHLNEDWIIVEPVHADMTPMENDREFSEGILVTDLANFVQPFIRYYVGDRVRIRKSDCDQCSLPILEVQGRSTVPFSICGSKYTSKVFELKAEVWPGLITYQVVQTSDDTIQLRGICAPDSKPEEVLGSLAAKMQEYFHENGAPGAKITWSAEPLIHNKRGGKTPQYINISNQ